MILLTQRLIWTSCKTFATLVDELELNAVLKTMNRYNLSVGIRRLMKFLNEDDTIAKLGGLSINLCTLANDLRAYEYTSDTAKEKADELLSDLCVKYWKHNSKGRALRRSRS